MTNKEITLKTLEKWEGIAFDHEPAFMEYFSIHGELIGISFSSENVNIYNVLHTGQHIKDSRKMEEWLEFIKTYEK